MEHKTRQNLFHSAKTGNFLTDCFILKSFFFVFKLSSSHKWLKPCCTGKYRHVQKRNISYLLVEATTTMLCYRLKCSVCQIIWKQTLWIKYKVLVLFVVGYIVQLFDLNRYYIKDMYIEQVSKLNNPYWVPICHASGEVVQWLHLQYFSLFCLIFLSFGEIGMKCTYGNNMKKIEFTNLKPMKKRVYYTFWGKLFIGLLSVCA